jgi:hypothetical protein
MIKEIKNEDFIIYRRHFANYRTTHVQLHNLVQPIVESFVDDYHHQGVGHIDCLQTHKLCNRAS